MKYHLEKALAFTFGGIVIVYGLCILVGLSNSGGASGGGIEGGRTSLPGTIIPFACYFLCGIVACFMRAQSVRKCLAVMAHLAPFAIIVTLRSWDAVGFSLIASAVLLVFFGFAWRDLLRESEP